MLQPPRTGSDQQARGVARGANTGHEGLFGEGVDFPSFPGWKPPTLPIMSTGPLFPPPGVPDETPRRRGTRSTSAAASASPVRGSDSAWPSPASPVDDVEWPDSPARVDWRKALPLGLIVAVCVGGGLWLTWPDSADDPSPSPSLATQAQEPTPSGRVLFEPLISTPQPSRTVRSGRPTPTSSPTASASSPENSPAVPSPRAPTSTVTSPASTDAVRPIGGPEEPPVHGSADPTCRTWGECHDEPPTR